MTYAMDDLSANVTMRPITLRVKPGGRADATLRFSKAGGHHEAQRAHRPRDWRLPRHRPRGGIGPRRGGGRRRPQLRLQWNGRPRRRPEHYQEGAAAGVL